MFNPTSPGKGDVESCRPEALRGKQPPYRQTVDALVPGAAVLWGATDTDIWRTNSAKQVITQNRFVFLLTGSSTLEAGTAGTARVLDCMTIALAPTAPPC